jgi:hypothetical protein
MTGPTDAAATYRRHDRRRVIGLVLAGCVLVGGLGAVAGEIFDPPPTTDRKVRPGAPGLGVVVTQGNTVAKARPASRVGGGTFRLDGTTQDPDLTGTLYDIGHDAPIFIPSDWEVYQTADTRLWAMNGKGSFAFAAAGAYNDASVRAGDVIQQNLEGLLPPDTYTQLVTSGPEDFGTMPYGELTSWSELSYEALWTDPQGSAPIHGQIYAGVRKDGAVLVVLIEHVPPSEWAETLYPRAAIVEQSFLRFARLF